MVVGAVVVAALLRVVNMSDNRPSELKNGESTDHGKCWNFRWNKQQIAAGCCQSDSLKRKQDRALPRHG
jgi:hypothetical protein